MASERKRTTKSPAGSAGRARRPTDAAGRLNAVAGRAASDGGDQSLIQALFDTYVALDDQRQALAPTASPQERAQLLELVRQARSAYLAAEARQLTANTDAYRKVRDDLNAATSSLDASLAALQSMAEKLRLLSELVKLAGSVIGLGGVLSVGSRRVGVRPPAGRPAETDRAGSGGERNFPPTPQSAAQAAAGRRIVLFQPGTQPSAVIKLLRDRAGLRVASTADAKSGALPQAQVFSAGGVLFDKLGVAVIGGEAAERGAVASALASGPGGDVISMSSPVRVVYALNGAAGHTGEYLSGFRDGVLSMTEAAGAPVQAGAALRRSRPGESFADTERATWGLHASRVLTSRFTGAGVRVAVLDSGLAFDHPDFAGRVPGGNASSFVDDVISPDDGNGHGTHCSGTAAGPLAPALGDVARYGVAHKADLLIGKVLTDEGWGLDEWFVAALNWAVTQQCRVVSFSIGGEPDTRYDRTFERIARRVLDAGTLIVAAAGNESRRSRGLIRPVCHPANCPSIMAVAAVDQDLRVADFSNRGSQPEGGQIDIAGPGVDVLSAWPPDGYELSGGTSMATPHVAGIAALYAEARPKMTARDLWSVIVQEARRLEASSADVGAGLVQAPR